jgi:hypothetical protein
VRRSRRGVFALVALYLLHNDLWWWDDPTLVLGLPIGLTYHLLLCLATAAVLGRAARGLGAGEPA